MKNIKELEAINCKIDKLSKDNQIEILRIMYDDCSDLISENKNGCFIEMNMLSEDTLQKINKFLLFIDSNEKELEDVENEKFKYKEYIKDN